MVAKWQLFAKAMAKLEYTGPVSTHIGEGPSQGAWEEAGLPPSAPSGILWAVRIHAVLGGGGPGLPLQNPLLSSKIIPPVSYASLWPSPLLRMIAAHT